VTSPLLTRRLSAGALALVMVTLSFVILAGQASSQTPESFRDDFASISYSGNNGSTDWSGSWQESGESDGPTSGNVQVTASDRCFGGSGNCLRIGSDGGNLANHGVSRTANLANAVSATLSFRYRRQTQGQVPGSVTVQVSSNGGSSWTTLTTINLAGPQKALTATLDISGHKASNTVVWFRGSGSGVTGNLYIDAVDVTANMAPPSTTTTVVTTTIPGTPTTTTTTVPGTPTTTTVPGTPTTTTTATVPGTPTTTIPGTPTTTTPGSPTTTLARTPTTTGPTSTPPGTPPTTTNTGGDATTPDVPAEGIVSAQEAAAQPQQASSTVDGLAPMAIAVETVSANAMTLGILALLASALVIVGIDRSKRQSPPDTDGESNGESEPPADN
jgi:hypothetical protein